VADGNELMQGDEWVEPNIDSAKGDEMFLEKIEWEEKVFFLLSVQICHDPLDIESGEGRKDEAKRAVKDTYDDPNQGYKAEGGC